MTLRDYYDDIQGQIEDPGPYSHNVIGSTLRIVANDFGKDAANQIIRDLGLNELGWEEEK